MAITAWSAKVDASSICLSVKGSTRLRCRSRTPMVHPLAAAAHRGTSVCPTPLPGEPSLPGGRPAHPECGPPCPQILYAQPSCPRSAEPAGASSPRWPQKKNHSWRDGDKGRPVAIRIAARSDRQSRAADFTRVLSTVCRSNVERLITFSTSAVAVCCCERFAQLVEQPRVLDGDDGLGGKVLYQLDLLVGERRTSWR